MTQVKLGRGELEHLAVEPVDLVDRDEDLSFPRDGNDDSDDERIVGAAQPDDDVGKAPERLTTAVGDRSSQQIRQAPCLTCDDPKVFHGTIQVGATTGRNVAVGVSTSGFALLA